MTTQSRRFGSWLYFVMIASTYVVLGALAYHVHLQGREHKAFELRTAAFMANINSLIASSPTMIVVSDKDGRIVGANDSAAKAFGYSMQEFIGLPLDRLMWPEWQVKHNRKYADAFTAERPTEVKFVTCDARDKMDSKLPLAIRVQVVGVQDPKTEKFIGEKFAVSQMDRLRNVDIIDLKGKVK